MMSHDFDKEEIHRYLLELGKAYRKMYGKHTPAEIVIVGGSAILMGYSFRTTTQDVDALLHAASGIKDAARIVADRFDLPGDWLNADFCDTESFSPKIIQYSQFYRQYANVLNVRIMTGKYLVAMKMKSWRSYKNDISDIIGILCEQLHMGKPLTYEEIIQALDDLYGGHEDIPEETLQSVRNYTEMKEDDLDSAYEMCRNDEVHAREKILAFVRENPGKLTHRNADELLDSILKK